MKTVLLLAALALTACGNKNQETPPADGTLAPPSSTLQVTTAFDSELKPFRDGIFLHKLRGKIQAPNRPDAAYLLLVSSASSLQHLDPRSERQPNIFLMTNGTAEFGFHVFPRMAGREESRPPAWESVKIHGAMPIQEIQHMSSSAAQIEVRDIEYSERLDSSTGDISARGNVSTNDPALLSAPAIVILELQAGEGKPKRFFIWMKNGVGSFSVSIQPPSASNRFSVVGVVPVKNGKVYQSDEIPDLADKSSIFELRGFTFHSKQNDAAFEYARGEGKLIALDSDQRKGTIFVRLSARSNSDEGDRVTIPVVLENGIGTVSVAAESFRAPVLNGSYRRAFTKPFEYSDWRVDGFVELEHVEVTER